MKKRIFLYGLSILGAITFGCNNDDDNKDILQIENQNPGNFSVQVSEITENSALLDWTTAVDPDDDEVVYTVFLGENTIESGLKTQKLLLEQLNAQTSYSGKVVASDTKGGVVEETFTFNTEEGEVINEEVSIAWEKSLGGTSDDEGYVIRQTSDGGYIVAGASESFDGDVGGNKGGKDCWIVKLDTSGNLVWEINIGGSDNDTVHDIQQTTDGGYIIGAFSNSGSGDVGGNNGMRDFWIIKLSASGNLVWETNIGGNKDDILESIIQTSDGGYVAVGFTSSDGFDVSGQSDAWIIKLDESGDFLWETNLGGPQRDLAFSVDETTDQGFIVAGHRETGGNKRDIWIAKLNATGSFEWEKTYVGSQNEEAESIEQTSDGGYIIGGYSRSGDGDIEENKGAADALVIKTDVSGNIQWKNIIGGTQSEGISDIHQTSDGGYIAVGSSSSNDIDIEENNGAKDFLILRLDTSGVILWQKNLGGEGDDYAFSTQQTADGGYVVAGWYANITGSGEGTTSEFNYWVIKLE
ncbi:T9SS C-terminal target domain-containing protein [Aquimarina sediminis]|uniref:T9SS C-terminal target domain-containing protein n=1 Tax=Aquimarina sediminis TaxID=2070536 RepID=UPI000FFEE56C|nr:T9SS C-terminal target domain-containing protein [Aquimarina sediminis]